MVELNNMLITEGKTNWKYILIVVVLAVIVGAGALWYSIKQAPPYQPPEIKKPENMVTEFFNWYIKEGSPSRISERTDVTEEYKQKIAQTTQVMVDPVIFAQAEPDEGIVTGEAMIINDTASLIVTLKYSGGGDHNLEVRLLLINNQWKINNITWPK